MRPTQVVFFCKIKLNASQPLANYVWRIFTQRCPRRRGDESDCCSLTSLSTLTRGSYLRLEGSLLAKIYTVPPHTYVLWPHQRHANPLPPPKTFSNRAGASESRSNINFCTRIGRTGWRISWRARESASTHTDTALGFTLRHYVTCPRHHRDTPPLWAFPEWPSLLPYPFYVEETRCSR